MRRSFWSRLTGLLASALIVTSCGGSQTGALEKNVIEQGRTQAAHAKSWVLAQAKNEDLVYVSDVNLGNVYVFSYGTGRLVGTLTGFQAPNGECADKAGDVWITDELAGQIVEYAHGGTTPIATLSDGYGFPVACSVDPTTGNLGVSTYQSGVAVYKNAQGPPALFSDSKFRLFLFCTYEDKGNLFFDGQADYSSMNLIGELPRGKNKIKNIELDESIATDSIAWDGQYLAITEGSGNPRGDTEIARFRIQGTKASLVSTVALQNQQGAAWDSQFWIQGNVIIGPTVHEEESGSGRLTYVWPYPQGGKHLKVLHRAQDGAQLIGTTFSAASR